MVTRHDSRLIPTIVFSRGSLSDLSLRASTDGNAHVIADAGEDDGTQGFEVVERDQPHGD